MKKAFDKSPLSYSKQISLLKSRGMIVPNEQQAILKLKHINYYRLCAYWLPFEQNHKTHQFKPNIYFEDVINLYVYDRKLRLLVLDGIELVEVSVRAHWAYHLAHIHGPHAHLQKTLFNIKFWNRNIKQLKKEVDRAEEHFIQHLKQKYAEALPPVWAVSEVMSLGLLSRFYDSLKPKATRRAIAQNYNLDDRVLQSWLHHLSVVRNICAHHSRLWNREFKITPKVPLTKPASLNSQFVTESHNIYNTLIILMYLTNVIDPNTSWKQRFIEITTQHNPLLQMMGFPKNWQEQIIWETQ